MTISDLSSKCEALRLSGGWQVQAVPLDAEISLQVITENWISVPECAHLQPVLYPDQPYWGKRLRVINDQAWVYRRTFEIPAGTFKQARLRFEGVDYFAEVWVNDQFVGRHEGHFVPFDLDVTRFLQTKELTLTVRVSAPWDAPNPTGTYPTNHVNRGLIKGLYEHGEGVIPPNVNPIGIWRPVWLLLGQGVSLEQMRIQSDLDGRVIIKTYITNSTNDLWSGKLDFSIEADNHNGAGVHDYLQITVPPGSHHWVQIIYIPEVHWWWPWDQGAPDLYRLSTLLMDSQGEVIDRKKESFGVRTIHLERSSERFIYWINGRSVYIRGSSYIPALYLSQCTNESLAHDLALAHDANLNLLRLHVHVSPSELYDLCDRAGMLIWQDFELNWIHDCSLQFEQRACRLQHEMIDLLGNHPSIITWACHNEPTMVFTRRQNLQQHPDPALYRDAQQQDPTRPVFLCSGQEETNWRHAGDTHSYYGSLWSRRYTDVYRHRTRLNTEFGFEAPASLDTLRAYPDLWQRLQHLEGQIDSLWDYQAALIQYQTEYFRRLRASGCAGYIHFWLIDLVPQVGCGVFDACRIPKGGYEALRRASQPMLVALEHDGRRPIALWILNDTMNVYDDAILQWQITAVDAKRLLDGEIRCDVKANISQSVMPVAWAIAPISCARITLQLRTASGELLCENEYRHPFQPQLRPDGYPWKFDPYLGTKVFNRPGALSLADQSGSPIVKYIPLKLREGVAEWLLRRHLPRLFLSLVARLVDALLN